MSDPSSQAEEYEKSEEVAITAGKKALSRAPWLFDRQVKQTKGFFVEVRKDPLDPTRGNVYVVDGNGTKLFLSSWSKNYRLGPRDGVLMNANDLATIIHAYPDSINIYFACQRGAEERYMGQVMDGFVDILEDIRIPNAPWNVNLGKMETASLDEMISLGVPNMGIDFGIVMTGIIQMNQIPLLNPQPGHYIVGLASSGLHSNGYTGGRHVVFSPSEELEYREEWRQQYKGKYGLHDKPAVLRGKTVLEAMQVPTANYLVDAALVGQAFDSRDIYGVNITGNGLHNFNRAGKGVVFEITDPLPLLPVHELLINVSGWTPQKSYTKQNNGMGFAFLAPTLDIAEGIVKMINSRGENSAKLIGRVGKGDSDELVTRLHKPYEGEMLTFSGYTA